MTAAVTTALALLAIAALWIAKQVLGTLLGEQAKGSVPDYAAKKVRAAADMLPAELAEEYETDWLAELASLKDKPISAIHYARGLPRAARKIAANGSTDKRHQPWRRLNGPALIEALVTKPNLYRYIVRACLLVSIVVAITVAATVSAPPLIQNLTLGSILAARLLYGIVVGCVLGVALYAATTRLVLHLLSWILLRDDLRKARLTRDRPA